MGRTCRQGNKGSFQLILLEHDLTYFDIDKKQIEDHPRDIELYRFLEKCRDKRASDSQQNNKDNLTKIREMHIESEQALKKLLAMNPA